MVWLSYFKKDFNIAKSILSISWEGGVGRAGPLCLWGATEGGRVQRKTRPSSHCRLLSRMVSWVETQAAPSRWWQ